MITLYFKYLSYRIDVCIKVFFNITDLVSSFLFSFRKYYSIMKSHTIFRINQSTIINTYPRGTYTVMFTSDLRYLL